MIILSLVAGVGALFLRLPGRPADPGSGPRSPVPGESAASPGTPGEFRVTGSTSDPLARDIERYRADIISVATANQKNFTEKSAKLMESFSSAEATAIANMQRIEVLFTEALDAEQDLLRRARQFETDVIDIKVFNGKFMEYREHVIGVTRNIRHAAAGRDLTNLIPLLEKLNQDLDVPRADAIWKEWLALEKLPSERGGDGSKKQAAEAPPPPEE